MYLNGAEQFRDFELIDTGQGYRLERWGQYILQRPDPQIIWQRSLSESEWIKADAIFRDEQWHFKQVLPESWELHFQDVRFLSRPTNFKHTGVFPEQAANWLLMAELLRGSTKPRVLNLFAYTGAATAYLTKKGAFVTHVDASRPALNWAKDNQKLNELAEDSVRWLLEDASKFVRSEVKRGVQYEGIVMDPPAFGHAPNGKIWKFNDQMPALVKDCVALLSAEAKFLIINAYATNTSELSIQNLLEDAVGDRPGKIESGQLCLAQRSGRLISTGIFARWTAI